MGCVVASGRDVLQCSEWEEEREGLLLVGLPGRYVRTSHAVAEAEGVTLHP